MCPEIHTTIAIQRHPCHQACGGVFVFIQQAKEQRHSHRIRRMRAAEAVPTAGIAVHQVQRVKCGFVRWTQPANQRFENTAAGKVTQSDSNDETEDDKEGYLP